MKSATESEDARILTEHLDVDEVIIMTDYRFQSRHRTERGWVRESGFLERRHHIVPVTLERRSAHA